MKKISYLLVLLIIPFLFGGCHNMLSRQIHEHCIRNGYINGDSTVSLGYEIYYTGDNLDLLETREEVMSNDQSILDTYEKSYKEIADRYKGIDNYIANVSRTATTVSIYMRINYKKVDTSRIIAIEGNDNNIFEDGVAKVDKWKSLAAQFGTNCSVIE